MRVAVETARLASERAAAVIRWRLGRGRTGLAAIAGSASSIGILSTLTWMREWVRVGFVEPPNWGCVIFRNPAEPIVFTAMGLLVTVLALWCHKYLSERLESIDTEMRAATLELANSLSLLRQR